MKFAFSTVSCPKWDFEIIVARGKALGYDGVELRGFQNEPILTAANPFLTDPDKLKKTFADAGIEICCLAGSIAMTQKRADDDRLAGELKIFIDLAQKLSCPIVKIFDTQVFPGQSRAAVGVMLGDWLLRVGDYAGERGVVVAVENALSFRAAKEMWSIIDRINHPSIGVCWDVFNAAQVGEKPSFSVPTLNSKIVYAHIKDAKLSPQGATYTKLGEGDVEARNFIRRLRGIGYRGYVTLDWEKAWLANLAEPEEILPDAIAKLRQWDEKQEMSDWESAAGVKKPVKAPAAHAGKPVAVAAAAKAAPVAAKTVATADPASAKQENP